MDVHKTAHNVKKGIIINGGKCQNRLQTCLQTTRENSIISLGATSCHQKIINELNGVNMGAIKVSHVLNINTLAPGRTQNLLQNKQTAS